MECSRQVCKNTQTESGMLAFEGAVRLMESQMTTIAQWLSCPLLSCSAVEEILQHGCAVLCTDCLLWRAAQTRNWKCVQDQKPQNLFSLLDVYLLGQSYGVTLARSLASRLYTSGFEVRGLIALDCRCVERTVLSTIYVVPRPLRQASVPIHLRCIDPEIHVVTPRVPRVTLSARDFCPRALLSPEMALASVAVMSACVRDGDHWEVPRSHAWDVVRA